MPLLARKHYRALLARRAPSTVGPDGATVLGEWQELTYSETLNRVQAMLCHTLNLVTPELVYVSDGQIYEKALQIANKLFPDVVLVDDNPPEGLGVSCLVRTHASRGSSIYESGTEFCFYV